MLLKDLQTEYLLNLEILGRAKGTIWNHTYSTKLFIHFVQEQFNISTIEEVKSIHIKQLILHWKNEKKWAARTINKMVGLIKVLFQYAIDEEYLSEFNNPIRKIKRN